MLKSDELAAPDSCLNKALPEERLFVLLARDPVAPEVIRYWCHLRRINGHNRPDDPQILEALECAGKMAEERAGVRDQVRRIKLAVPTGRTWREAER